MTATVRAKFETHLFCECELSRDVFLHRSNFQDVDFNRLREGDKIIVFDVELGGRGWRAGSGRRP